MEKITGIPTVSVLLLLIGVCHVALTEEEKTYIVHMARSEMPLTFVDHARWYDSSLKSVSPSRDIIYNYNNAIHGFAARLTPAEAREMEARPGTLSVLPETKYVLHTTRTPSFLGLDQNADMFPESESASDVVVGVLDTGVWPESPSFDDTGYMAIPNSWKGACEVGTNFNESNCNKKLIGARYFAKGYEATLGPIDVKSESKSPREKCLNLEHRGSI